MPLLAYEEALERVLQRAARLGVEQVALDGATGRVLASNVTARGPLPATDRSAMDGFAVSVGTLAGAGPWTLEVRSEGRAGGAVPSLPPGGACRIFTGAELPGDADAVVMQEAVTREGTRIVVPHEARPRPGQNVRRRGEDMEAGAIALVAGTRLSPAMVGLAAALDLGALEVGRLPRVAFLATGDELRLPGSPDRPGSIPESNAVTLSAIAQRAGATCRILPSVGDDAARLAAAIRTALPDADLLVTIGGASVGDHDLVRPTLESLGARFAFSGVSMRPGKPTAAAELDGLRVLCLPGNPASATLAFHLFGVPLLRALQGATSVRPEPCRISVVGQHRRSLPTCDGRDDFLRARLERHDGELRARLAASQSSGAPTSFAHADALVILRGREERIVDGEAYPTLLLADLAG